YGYLVNISFVAEEVVRTLVGSLGLIAAVPLTTAVAAGFALNRGRLGAWEQVLGPEGSGGHIH
ncbi:MAG: YibE/F family protein, partial [Chloroflexota bacterium]